MISRRSWPLWLLFLMGIAAFLVASLAGTTSQATALDDDHDGVVNSADKCPGTPQSTAVDEVGCKVVTPGPSVQPPPKGNNKATCNPNVAIAAKLGVKVSDLWVGGNVDWTATPETNPRNAFSSVELSSPRKLANFLGDDSHASREARKLVKSALAGSQATRALKGDWIPVQLKSGKTIRLENNYQLIDRSVVKRPSVSQAGEVFWVFVPSDCDGTTVVIRAMIRAWCGNPQIFARE